MNHDDIELVLELHKYLLTHETVELMQLVIDAIHEKNEREKEGK